MYREEFQRGFIGNNFNGYHTVERCIESVLMCHSISGEGTCSLTILEFVLLRLPLYSCTFIFILKQEQYLQGNFFTLFFFNMKCTHISSQQKIKITWVPFQYSEECIRSCENQVQFKIPCV